MEFVPNTKICLEVPWESQLDNASGFGWRECFSSSCAMLARYWGKVKNDAHYCKQREKHGDSTDARAQIETLKALGLTVSFRTNARRASISEEIFLKRPVAVGWLHQGPPNFARGGGHWSVVVGLTDSGVIMHDPNGEADLIRGGYLPSLNGAYLDYSWKNWGPRWEVEGPGSGWLLTCRL